MHFSRPRNRIWSAAPATGNLLSVSVLRDHVRSDAADEDQGLLAMAAAAADLVEKHTQRLLTERSCTLMLRELPCGQTPLVLPGGRVASVTSFLVDGVALAGVTVAGDSPALAIPADDWPTPVSEGHGVTITYVAGYPVNGAPPALLASVKMLTAEMFANREAGSAESLAEVPFGPAMMMRPYRIWSI